MRARRAAALSIVASIIIMVIIAAGAAEAQRKRTESPLITAGRLSKAQVESVNRERTKTLAALQDSESEDAFRMLGWTVEEAYYGFLTIVGARFTTDAVQTHTHEYLVGYISPATDTPLAATTVQDAQRAQESFDFDLLLHDKQGLAVQAEFRRTRTEPAKVTCTLTFVSSKLKSTTCAG